VKLYRRLVENGGQASILSLPAATSYWRLAGSAPEDLLRQLNVTARMVILPRDVPLEFSATDHRRARSLAAETAAPTPAAPVVASLRVSLTPLRRRQHRLRHYPDACLNIGRHDRATNSPAYVAPGPALPAVMEGASAPKPVTAPVHVSASNLGLHDLDRAEAQLHHAQTHGFSPTIITAETAELPKTAQFLPSEPPPAAGSTSALVWKPTLERLEAPPPNSIITM